MKFRRFRLGIGFALVLALASVTAGLAQTASPAPSGAAAAPTAPAAAPSAAAPAPAAPIAAPTAAPSAAPSAGPRRGRRAPGPAASSASAEPSDTPEPPQFTTLDGIWEVELQPLGKRLAVYSHLSIAVTGTTISGYWEHTPGRTKSKMTGTFDGRLISMDIANADGTTSQFSGYVENFADMVGLFRASDKDAGTAFTGQHRKKLKV